MMKLKTIAVSLVLIGLGAYGASLAAPQADPKAAPNLPRRRSYPTAEKSKSKGPTSLVSLGDYVVEPLICCWSRCWRLFPAGRFPASAWFGRMARSLLVFTEMCMSPA